MQIYIKDFINDIEGEVLTSPETIAEKAVSDGYVSDLLSDVMGNAKDNQVWITIMKHLNSVAVASLTNIPCIIFANGIKPEKDVIAKAEEENVCLISSKLSGFHLAGRLYALLKL